MWVSKPGSLIVPSRFSIDFPFNQLMWTVSSVAAWCQASPLHRDTLWGHQKIPKKGPMVKPYVSTFPMGMFPYVSIVFSLWKNPSTVWQISLGHGSSSHGAPRAQAAKQWARNHGEPSPFGVAWMICFSDGICWWVFDRFLVDVWRCFKRFNWNVGWCWLIQAIFYTVLHCSAEVHVRIRSAAGRGAKVSALKIALQQQPFTSIRVCLKARYPVYP